MTLSDEIITINYMIKVNPDATIGDYLKERKEMLADEHWHRRDEMRRQRHKDWLKEIKKTV